MTQADNFQSPIDMLFHWAGLQPDAIFLNQPIENKKFKFTWKQVAHEVACMASQLSQLPPQSKVAIISLNCAHWMMADWAIQMAGHVAVPIYPTATQKIISYVLNHAEVKAVFVGKLWDYDHVMPAIPRDLVQMSIYLPHHSLPFWDDMVAENKPMAYQRNIVADQLMSIVYTSGTTGDPKGVMVSYGALSETMKLIKDRVDINTSDRYVSYLPLAHIAERVGVEMATLYKGAQVFFVRSLDQFNIDVKRAKPTVFFGVPRIWQKLKNGVDDKLGGDKRSQKLLSMPVVGGLLKWVVIRKLGFKNTRFAICAAAAVPKSLLEWFQQLGIKLNEAYGMTETCGLSHMAEDADTMLGSVGKPLSGCECMITTQGEVCLRNPAVMIGYYKNEALTNETIDSDGWLHTGDLGHIDEKGYLFITGRIKDIFKTAKGKYVAPIPIEKKLMAEIPLDHVILMGSGLGQPVLVVSIEKGSVVLKAFEDQCLEALTLLQTQLEPHEKPSHLFISYDEWTAENGLLTPTLKIQRNNVEQHYIEKVTPMLSKPGVYLI